VPRLVHSFINTRKGYLKCNRCGTEKHEVGKRSAIFGATVSKEYRKHGTREWGSFIQCFDPRQVDVFDDGTRDDPRNFPPTFKPKLVYSRDEHRKLTDKPSYNPVSLYEIIGLEIDEDSYWLGIQREFLVKGFNAKGEPIGVHFWDICTKGEIIRKVELGKTMIGLIKNAAIRLSSKDGAQWWHLCDGEKWLEIPWWLRARPCEDAFYDIFTEDNPTPDILPPRFEYPPLEKYKVDSNEDAPFDIPDSSKKSLDEIFKDWSENGELENEEEFESQEKDEHTSI